MKKAITVKKPFLFKYEKYGVGDVLSDELVAKRKIADADLKTFEKNGWIDKFKDTTEPKDEPKEPKKTKK